MTHRTNVSAAATAFAGGPTTRDHLLERPDGRRRFVQSTNEWAGDAGAWIEARLPGGVA